MRVERSFDRSPDAAGGVARYDHSVWPLLSLNSIERKPVKIGVPLGATLPNCGLWLRYPLIQISPPPPKIASALDSSPARAGALLVRSSSIKSSRNFSEPSRVANGST